MIFLGSAGTHAGEGIRKRRRAQKTCTAPFYGPMKKKVPADVYRLRGTSIDFFLVGGKGLEPLTVGV